MESACEECPNRAKRNKTKAVLKRGSNILICGGALTTPMATQGRKMSREAIDLLNTNMDAVDLQEDDFSYTSFVRCAYDPDLYDTKENKIIKKQCRSHLKAVIARDNPKVIVPLGAEAASSVMGHAVKITKARGVPLWSDEFNCWVLPTINPHTVHLNPQHEPIFASDCKSLRRLIDSDYDPEEAGRAMLGDYSMVTDLQFLIDEDPAELAFDVETLGLNFAAPDTDLLTIQLCPEPGRGYLIPWNHPESPIGRRQQHKLRKQLKILLTSPDRLYYGQNLKFDVLWLWEALGFRARIDHDAKMLAALLDENLQNKDLDTLTKLYCPSLAGYADAFNSKYDKSRMDLVPLAEIINYGIGDTDASLRVCHYLLDELEKDPKLLNHYNRVSIPGLNTFAAIERRGQEIDTHALDEFEEVLAAEVDRQYNSLIAQVPDSIQRDHAEKGLKFTRAAFLLDILFYHEDGFKLKPTVFTAKTQKLSPDKRIPSVSSKTHLPFFFDECPFTIELSTYIKANRLLGTNVRKFRENYIIDEKVYPSYALDHAVTGRSSSRNPNCFPPTVEVLTEDGWQFFGQVAAGTKIAQWTRQTGDIDFAHPIDEVEHQFDGDLINLHTEFFIDVLCTPNHRFHVRSRRGDINKTVIAENYPTEYLQPCSGVYRRGNIHIPHDKLRLLLALQADGHVTKNSSILWAFVKKRKATALLGALAAEGIRYTTHKKEGYYQYYVSFKDRPDWLVKRFTTDVLRYDSDTLARFCEELFLWDGDSTRFKTWVSANSSDMDIVQAAFTLNGDRAWKRQLTDTCQVINVTQDLTENYTTNHTKTPIPYSGTVYCYQMPQDSLIVRHNGRVAIVGNSQNYPKHGPLATAYRKIFIPPPQRIQIEADYSQAEVRIAADMANETTMLDIYNSDGDIHLTTAAMVRRMDLDEFVKLPKDEIKEARRRAKAVSLGYLYSMWWKTFVSYAKTSFGVDFTLNEAERIRNDFFELYPGLAMWHDDMKAYAMEHGYVRSYSGRIRHLPMVWSDDQGIQSEALRQAINSSVQEFGSSLGVMAMSRLEQNINPLYLPISGFVHDALYASVEPRHLLWGARMLKYYMETNPIKKWFGIDMKVKIVADVGFGMNGGEVNEMEALTFKDPYDFTQHDLSFDLPKQEIPPNGGRYTPEPHLINYNIRD